MIQFWDVKIADAIELVLRVVLMNATPYQVNALVFPQGLGDVVTSAKSVTMAILNARNVTAILEALSAVMLTQENVYAR